MGIVPVLLVEGSRRGADPHDESPGAINGAAMGGGAGLAIAGDLALMAESAKLGYPEPKHGIVAAIVMANLVRQVGRKAAFELVAFGDPIDAARALELGGDTTRWMRNFEKLKKA